MELSDERLISLEWRGFGNVNWLQIKIHHWEREVSKPSTVYIYIAGWMFNCSKDGL